jgi:uncharacterized protein (DUF697 family)
MLVPIQLGMMAKIAQIYKIKFDRAGIAAVAATTAATSAGRATFTGLLKLVPGAGTVAGGVVGAGVASTFTFAMGSAWLVVCQQMVRGRFGSMAGAVDSDQIRQVFLDEFKSKLTIRRKDPAAKP